MAAIQQVLFATTGSAATGADALLREDGFYVLREDGFRVLLESATTEDSLLREDGFYVIREDGGRILLEGAGAPIPANAILDTDGLPILDTAGNYIVGV